MKGCDTLEAAMRRTATLNAMTDERALRTLARVRDQVVGRLNGAGLSRILPKLDLELDEQGARVSFLAHKTQPSTEGRVRSGPVDLGIDALDPTARLAPGAVDKLGGIAVHLAADLLAAVTRDDALSGMGVAAFPAWAWTAHPLALDVMRRFDVDPIHTCRPDQNRPVGSPEMHDYNHPLGILIQSRPDGVRLHHRFIMEKASGGWRPRNTATEIPAGRTIGRSPLDPVFQIACDPDGTRVTIAGALPETAALALKDMPLASLIGASFLTPDTLSGRIRIEDVEVLEDATIVHLADVPYVAMGDPQVAAPWLEPDFPSDDASARAQRRFEEAQGC